MDKFSRYDRIGLDEWAAEYSARLRTALVMVITQRVVAIFYRRFGTTYRPHPEGYDSVTHSAIAIHLDCSYVL
jgi:hypothetical protein